MTSSRDCNWIRFPALAAATLCLLWPGTISAGAAREQPAAKGTLTIRGQVLSNEGPVDGATVFAAVEGGADVLSQLPCPFDCDDQPLIHVVGIPRNPGSDATWGPLADVVLSGRGQPAVAGRTVSRADGSFVLEGLGKGRYTLWADLPGKLVGYRTGIAAGETKATVEVEPGGFVRGKLVHSDRRPLAGVAVTAALLEPTRYFDSITRADGSFSIGPIPLGFAMVVARFQGLLPAYELTESPGVVGTLWLRSAERLSGTVLRGGAPAAGATVSLGSRQTTTGVDGSFTFTDVEPQEYHLSATLGSHLATALVRLPFRRGLRLELAPTGEIAGAIRKAGDKPVSGAELECHLPVRDGRWISFSATSGSDGRYRLPTLEPGSYQCHIWDRRFLREKRDVALRAGETLTVDFTLKAASPIAGTVVDEAGKPVAEVDIRATGKTRSEDFSVAKSRRDGSFSLGSLPAGSFEVEFKRAPFLGLKTTLAAPSAGVRIVLRKGLEAFGVVFGPDQRPASGATVFLRPRSGDGSNEWWGGGRTNVRGEFRISGSTAGAYQLVASAADENDAARAQLEVKLNPRATGPFRLQLRKGLSINGVVTGPGGKPVARAYVEVAQKSRLEGEETPGVVRAREIAVHSADDGSFSFANLEPGTYELSCSRSDGELRLPKGQTLVVPAGGDPVTVALVPDASAVGRVVRESGEPVPLFEIDDRDWFDPEGRFRLSEYTERVRTLVFTAEGFAPARRQVEFRQGQESNLGDVVLKIGREVRGRVLDARTGSAIAGARLTAGPADLVRPLESKPLTTAATVSGADGSFSLSHLEPGPLTLCAEAPGHRFFFRAIGPSEESVTLRMESGVDLRGRVTDTAGKPLEFGHVAVVESSGRYREAPLENGDYRLDGVAPGRLVIKADARENEGNFFPQTIDLPDSGELRLDFRERPGSVHLEVTGVPDGSWSLLVPGEVPAPQHSSLALLLQGLTNRSHLEPGTYSLFVIQKERPYAVRRQIIHLGSSPEQTVAVEPPSLR